MGHIQSLKERKTVLPQQSLISNMMELFSSSLWFFPNNSSFCQTDKKKNRRVSIILKKVKTNLTNNVYFKIPGAQGLKMERLGYKWPELEIGPITFQSHM